VFLHHLQELHNDFAAGSHHHLTLSSLLGIADVSQTAVLVRDHVDCTVRQQKEGEGRDCKEHGPTATSQTVAEQLRPKQKEDRNVP